MQPREFAMPWKGQTREDSSLDELVDRLTELTKRLPRSDRPEATSLSPGPTVGDADDDAQIRDDPPAAREFHEELMQVLRRIEATQARHLADLRHQITQEISRLAPALEHSADLSASSVQKLRAALGLAALESTERRILAELAEIKAGLQRQAEKPIQRQKGGGLPSLIVAFALAIILFGGGAVVGTVEAALIDSWLQRLLGFAF